MNHSLWRMVRLPQRVVISICMHKPMDNKNNSSRLIISVVSRLHLWLLFGARLRSGNAPHYIDWLHHLHEKRASGTAYHYTSAYRRKKKTLGFRYHYNAAHLISFLIFFPLFRFSSSTIPLFRFIDSGFSLATSFLFVFLSLFIHPASFNFLFVKLKNVSIAVLFPWAFAAATPIMDV